MLHWPPVRFLITRAARAYGFLDPVGLLAKLRGFAQPSEVAEPIELLRAGMLFHARGLVNTKAIQNNLDWVWPYWVERQFNPNDESFIPRAFSFSHINLTHRNWTAVGQPGVPYYPIVDPRGLVTPLFDGWSLDTWVWSPTEPPLLPSKLDDFQQELILDDNLLVRSRAEQGTCVLTTEVQLCLATGQPLCRVTVEATGPANGFVVIALRPYNPEGVSFVEKVALLADEPGWLINGRHPVIFDRPPSRQVASIYKEGDVLHRLTEPTAPAAAHCPVGLASAAALFPLRELRAGPLEVRVPIFNELEPKKRPVFTGLPSWSEALTPLARLRLGDATLQRLYDHAVANLVLHAPEEVYPGPYTYKRFWFRDAAFILNALLTLGDAERTRRALTLFPTRQRRDGYFLSQEGEWDANGEALWIFHRYATLSQRSLPEAWLRSVARGARWIQRKRLPRDTGRPEAGLLPAGFSAEHLGPNDFYYWDDFWSVAGLRCAAALLRATEPLLAVELEHEAEEFLGTIERSLPDHPHRRFPGAIPASPRRRMDSGAVGSLVADYPLQLFPPGDARILKTVAYLRDHSMHGGGFFQNMIHSGINAYLTLHLAQVHLRAGEVEAAWRLLDTVAALASPTGQWPEAIHPRTAGGCMGDGQHIWAAAEWALFLRNCFIREEGEGLIVGAGVRPSWWRSAPASLGATLTPFGSATVEIAPLPGEGVRVTLTGAWRDRPPAREIRVPGYAFLKIAPGDPQTHFDLSPLKALRSVS